MLRILTVAALLVLPFAAEAGCYCACMNGANQPICSSAIDVRPICGPAICPIEPPAISPILPLKIPPLGTQTCVPQQVWDQNLRQYVWKRICY
jgi:hypothetical protein